MVTQGYLPQVATNRIDVYICPAAGPFGAVAAVRPPVTLVQFATAIEHQTQTETLLPDSNDDGYYRQVYRPAQQSKPKIIKD